MTIHDVIRFGIGTKSGTEVLIVSVGEFHEEGKGGVNNKTIKSTHLVKKKKSRFRYPVLFSHCY